MTFSAALAVDVLMALLIGLLSSRRDWSQSRRIGHPDWNPFAETPALWVLACLCGGPVGWIAYALDHSHAPMRAHHSAIEPGRPARPVADES